MPGGEINTPSPEEKALRAADNLSLAVGRWEAIPSTFNAEKLKEARAEYVRVRHSEVVR